VSDWCAIHDRNEPTQPGDYLSCFECGHVWRSEADYRADCEDVALQFPKMTVENVRLAGCCPLCTHDFLRVPEPLLAEMRLYWQEVLP
jgi:hypothetical protein